MIDELFHYYGTYIAGRFAGMEQSLAQRLAYYCYSMSELQHNGEAVHTWLCSDLGDEGDRAFTPCVVTCNSDYDQFGPYNCRLAFTELPCLSATGGKGNFDPPNAFELSFNSGNNQQRLLYSPLANANWPTQINNHTSIGRKIVSKFGRFRRQSMLNQQTRFSIQDSNPRLRCIANSAFSREMLNYGIKQKTHADAIDPLAHFGCRLFVYQRTWLQEICPEQSSDNDKIQTYLAAFYWSAYAIQCYLANKTITDKLHIRLLPDTSKVDLLNSVLRSIFAFNGNRLEQEHFYLSRLSCILSYGKITHNQHIDTWYQGLRLRPDFLIEKALIESGGGCSKQIKFLTAFKQSDFYYLNKAAQDHSKWVDKQLQLHGLGEYATAQYCHF